MVGSPPRPNSLQRLLFCSSFQLVQGTTGPARDLDADARAQPEGLQSRPDFPPTLPLVLLSSYVLCSVVVHVALLQLQQLLLRGCKGHRKELREKSNNTRMGLISSKQGCIEACSLADVSEEKK